MQYVSQAYQDLLHQPVLPQPYELACMLEVVNQEAQEQASLEASGLTYYSAKSHQPFTPQQVYHPFATCEQDFVRLDGSYYFLPEEYETITDPQPIVGSQLSDAAGAIDQIITVQFQNACTFDIKGLTLVFDHAIPTKFTIEDADGTVLKQVEQAALSFKTNDVFTFHKGMRIHIHQIDLPYTRCRIKQIMFGMFVELTNEQVISMEYRQQLHPCSIDCYCADMSITCINLNGEYDPENPSSVINFLERLQDIDVSCALPFQQGKEALPLAHLYLNEWSSTQNEVTFKAVDLFSFLESPYHQTHELVRASAYALIEHIIMDAGIEHYDIDSALHNIIIENPLPPGTHKDGLLLICNASQSVCWQDRNGTVMIRKRQPVALQHQILREDMLESAVGTKLEQVKEMVIQYTIVTSGIQKEQIAKGTYEPGEILITFTDPVEDVTISDPVAASIKEYGPYHVILQVAKATELVVNGIKMQSSIQQVHYPINERGVIKTIENPLVSSQTMAAKQYAWMSDYVTSDRSYECRIRGRMELDPLDILGIENPFNPQLQIQMQDHTLTFTGSIQSKLSGKKVRK